MVSYCCTCSPPQFIYPKCINFSLDPGTFASPEQYAEIFTLFITHSLPQYCLSFLVSVDR